MSCAAPEPGCGAHEQRAARSLQCLGHLQQPRAAATCPRFPGVATCPSAAGPRSRVRRLMVAGGRETLRRRPPPAPWVEGPPSGRIGSVVDSAVYAGGRRVASPGSHVAHLADAKDATPGQIALAWLLAQHRWI